MDSPRSGGSGGGGGGGGGSSHGNTGKSGQSGRGALEQSAHSSGSGDYDTGSGDSSQMPFLLDEDGSPHSGTLTSPSGAQPIPHGQYHNQQPYQHSAYHHLQPHSAPAQQHQQQYQQHHSAPVHHQQQQQQQHHSGSERQFSAEKTRRGVGGVSVAAAAAVAMHVRDAAAAGAGTFAAAGNWLSSSPLGRRTFAASLPGRVLTENKHSTDVKPSPPTPRICMSIHP